MDVAEGKGKTHQWQIFCLFRHRKILVSKRLSCGWFLLPGLFRLLLSTLSLSLRKPVVVMGITDREDPMALGSLSSCRNNHRENTSNCDGNFLLLAGWPVCWAAWSLPQLLLACSQSMVSSCLRSWRISSGGETQANLLTHHSSKPWCLSFLSLANQAMGSTESWCK